MRRTSNASLPAPLRTERDLMGAAAVKDTMLQRGVREVVNQYGPFVMNSEGEIAQALADYRAGNF